MAPRRLSPLTAKPPLCHQTRSPRCSLLIQHPLQQRLIPRKVRTRQSQRQRREYQVNLARGCPMRRSAGARGGSWSSTPALRDSSPGYFFWVSLSFPVHLPEPRRKIRTRLHPLAQARAPLAARVGSPKRRWATLRIPHCTFLSFFHFCLRPIIFRNIYSRPSDIHPI